MGSHHPGCRPRISLTCFAMSDEELARGAPYAASPMQGFPAIRAGSASPIHSRATSLLGQLRAPSVDRRIACASRSMSAKGEETCEAVDQVPELAAASHAACAPSIPTR